MAGDLIDVVGDAGGVGLVLLTFALAFAESAVLLDLFVPGEVGLVVAGAAVDDAGAPLWAVVGAGALGAVAGDSVGYLIGRRFGAPVINRWRWTRRRLEPRLDRARRYFERRGGPAVAGARWVGALRAVVPVVAGTAHMPYRRFVIWDAPSALAWAAAMTTAGFLAGDDIAEVVDDAGTAVSLVVIFVVIGIVLWRRRQRRRTISLR